MTVQQDYTFNSLITKSFSKSSYGLVINPLYPHLGESLDGIVCFDVVF